MMKNRWIWAGLLAFMVVTPTEAARAENFVVDPAVGCSEAKGEDAPYCTIQDAIDAAFADGGGEVQVMPGTYRESIVLRDDVKVQGEGTVVIELPEGPLPLALVTAANESHLGNLTLRLPEGRNAPIPLLLIAGVEDVEIEEVIFDGGMNRDSIGVYVQSQMLETSQIRKSELRRLEVGVLAEDTRFRITRCLFEDILRDAIYVRQPSSKGLDDDGDDEFDAPEVGDEDDLEFSGFNRFRSIGGFMDELGNPINENDAFLLRNTTGTALTAQLNDWGIYETAAIATQFSASEPGAKGTSGKGSAPVIFEPYIGKSIFPGSVFARIRNAVDRALLTNAEPRLRLGGVDTGIEPAFDAVSKLYSFTFVNPNTYAILAQAPGFFSTTRPAIVGPGEIFATDISLDPDASSEGEPVDSPHSTDQNADGKVNLSELLRVVQFFNGSQYHCDTAGEDGFAVGTGLQTCAPHASDYAPQDWLISLSETLRTVQFFNSGGYYPCAGSEDGYCPGAQR